MIQIAKDFVEFAKSTRNSLQVVLFCDNLAIQCSDTAKQIFPEGKVFLHYFLPNITESSQLIDLFTSG